MDSIVVISTEPSLAETLASELAGISVEQARLSQERTYLISPNPRLVLVDDGIDIRCVPEAFRSQALQLKRPVSLSQLLYTIRERLQGKTGASREELALSAGVKFYPSERLLRAHDVAESVVLTEKETELLRHLLEASGHCAARDVLLRQVWGYSDAIDTHTLETHIYRLRGKLRQANEKLDINFSDDGRYILKL